MGKTYKYLAFGRHFRSVRKLRYPELRAFSKTTGILEKQRYDYETSRIFPPIQKFITIFKYLDKSAAYMLSPFIEYTQNERDIMNFFEEADAKEILKAEEMAKILKFTLLGFQMLYLTKKYFGDTGDIIDYLKSVKQKLFEQEKLKKSNIRKENLRKHHCNKHSKQYNETSISFLWIINGVTITYTGTISGNTISGHYSTTNEGSDSWIAEKTSEPGGRTYQVYGGNTYLSCDDFLNPERNDEYTLLGTASNTQTFLGSYSHYIIVTRPGNIAYIDTVLGSNGEYLSANGGSNVIHYYNVGGASDGYTAAVGGFFNGTWDGSIIFDAPYSLLSSITVYIIKH